MCSEAACSDGEVTSESVCNGGGACTTASSSTCPSSECASDGSAKCAISCTSTSCSAGSYCDTKTGACIPQLDDGVLCSANAQCTSNICADGVCCDKACTGCSACTLALNGQGGSARDGQCLPVVAGKAAPHGACVASASAPCGQNGLCDGANGCQYPPVNTVCASPSCSGSTLTTSTCDSTHVCVPNNEPCPNSLVCASATQCKTGSCTDDKDCAAGYCVTGACSTTKKVGDACGSAGECPNGYCVDGYCCNDPCDGQCQTCKQSPGQCRTTTTPRTACTGTGTCGTRYCDGTHASCVFPGAETACPDQCNAEWTAVLESTCNGSGACGAGTPNNCGSSQYCSTSTNRCTDKLSSYSTACSRDVQCSSAKCCSVCVDASSDNNNCGSCGNTCGANRHCQGGGCACDYTMPAACGSTCGSWNFESGSTEGWDDMLTPGQEAFMMTNGAGNPSVNSAHPAGGSSYSMAVPITLTNGGAAWCGVVGVQLCVEGQATNLAGYSIAGSLYVTGSSMNFDANASVLAWGPPTDMGFETLYILEQGLQLNTWYHFNFTLSESRPIDHIGIMLDPAVVDGWSGTMYIDNVRFL